MAQNYYQILEVPADANITVIKKSFRKLAMQFHPDKNPGNSLKQNYYLIIQEAYQTLSDPQLRKNYDTELWLSQKNTSFHHQVLNPEMMIKRLQQLAEMMKIKKEYFVLEDHLTAFLLDAMNDNHIAIFQAKATYDDYNVFSDYILFLAQDLPKPFRDKVFERLLLTMHEFVSDLDTKIDQINLQRKSNDWFQRNFILVLFSIGLLLCIIMYLYVKQFRGH